MKIPAARQRFSLFILSWITLSLTFVSCQKDKEPGSVSGSFRSPYSAIAVYLDNASGERIHSTSIDEKGKFAFPQVSPGAYTLRVKNAPLYKLVADIPVTVLPGEDNLIPEIRVDYDGSLQHGSLTYTMDGNPFAVSPGTLGLEYGFSQFRLTATTTVALA